MKQSFRNNRGRKFSGNQKSKKGKSVLDYRTLEAAGKQKPVTKKYTPQQSFADMIENNQIKSNIEKKGFSHPTEIQEETYSHVKNGHNVVGIANTGTGKTAAFLIPLLEQFAKGNNQDQIMVIVPTRELAAQVEQEFRELSLGLKMNSACFIGGTNLNTDLRKAKQSNDLIIGTPGRLVDLLSRKALNLSKVKSLVLDEFDRMLDMGFINDIQRILGYLKGRKQTLLFSATRDKSQKNLIQEIAPDAKEFAVSSGSTASQQIEQNLIKVKSSDDKFILFKNLIGQSEFEKVIVFAETKRMVDKLAKKLNQSGIQSSMIHGDKSQNFRTKAIKQFKDGKNKILVATDVVARGIDIDNITHVINYQTPQTIDSYLHRIGRTGRAGRKGTAYTFVDDIN